MQNFFVLLRTLFTEFVYSMQKNDNFFEFFSLPIPPFPKKQFKAVNFNAIILRFA